MPFTPFDPSTAAIAPVTTAGDPATANGINFAEFKQGITEDLKNRGDISTRLPGWINRAYRNLAGMLDINELNASMELNLVADQPFYMLPDVLSWITWTGVEDSTDYLDGGRGFEMIDVPTYRKLPDSTAFSASGVLPFKYLRYARMYVIWPTPADDFDATVDFRVRPAPLINNEDCPLFPAEFHDVMFDMAEAIAMRKLGMRTDGDRVWNDAVTALRPLLNSDAAEKDNMHMVMQPIRQKQQLFRGRS